MQSQPCWLYLGKLIQANHPVHVINAAFSETVAKGSLSQGKSFAPKLLPPCARSFKTAFHSLFLIRPQIHWLKTDVDKWTFGDGTDLKGWTVWRHARGRAKRLCGKINPDELNGSYFDARVFSRSYPRSNSGMKRWLNASDPSCIPDLRAEERRNPAWRVEPICYFTSCISFRTPGDIAMISTPATRA